LSNRFLELRRYKIVGEIVCCESLKALVPRSEENKGMLDGGDGFGLFGMGGLFCL